MFRDLLCGNRKFTFFCLLVHLTHFENCLGVCLEKILDNLFSTCFQQNLFKWYLIWSSLREGSNWIWNDWMINSHLAGALLPAILALLLFPVPRSTSSIGSHKQAVWLRQASNTRIYIMLRGLNILLHIIQYQSSFIKMAVRAMSCQKTAVASCLINHLFWPVIEHMSPFACLKPGLHSTIYQISTLFPVFLILPLLLT